MIEIQIVECVAIIEIVMQNAKSVSKRLTILSGMFESVRMLTGAIHAFFFLSMGVSLKQLAILQIVFSGTIIICEFPTGVFADVINRKIATVLACSAVAIYYPLCLFAPNLNILIPGQVIFGIGMCFMSGAMEAWMVETIAIEFPQQPMQINHFGHMRKEVAGIGNMLSAPLGAVIAAIFSTQIVYLIATLSMLSLAVLLASTQNLTKDKLQNSMHASIRNSISITKKYLVKSKNGSLYLIISALIIAVYQPIYHFWQPLFISFFYDASYVPSMLKHDTAILGITFFCVSSLIYIINKYFRSSLINKFKPLTIAWVIALVIALILLELGSSKSTNLFFYLFLFSGLHGLMSAMQTIADTQYFKITPHQYLSTIFSVKGAAQRIASVLTLICIAKFISAANLRSIFSASSILVLFIALCFMLWSSFYQENLTEELQS